MGPAGVAVLMHGPWVLGALANQQWSVAGWGDRSVSQFLIQPFVNFNLGDGWYLKSNPIITANWKNDSGDKWTVPVGGRRGQALQARQAADQHLGGWLLQRPEDQQ